VQNQDEPVQQILV